MTNKTNIERARAKLISRYANDEEGVWQVRGEDENADLGGSHYMPTLGYFRGKYVDVLDYALSLNRFFAWGAGGDITKIEVYDIDENSTAELVAARAEYDAAKEALIKAEERLNKMEGR